MTRPAASSDLLRLLAAFIEPPRADHPAWAQALGIAAPADLETWRAAHTETFVVRCYPYVSVYVGDEGAIGGEAADRVAGFRGLLGSQVDGAPDSLVALLADYAALAERSADDAQARHARRALLWEHLLCWLMPYLDSVSRAAPAPYADWARLMRVVFGAEAGAYPSPERLPLHLRSAPSADIATVHDGLDACVRALLVPVRSGLVLTHNDLSVIAGELDGLPVYGGRQFALRALIERAPEETLRGLALAARSQVEKQAADRQVLGVVADFWQARSAATADALASMADGIRSPHDTEGYVARSEEYVAQSA